MSEHKWAQRIGAGAAILAYTTALSGCSVESPPTRTPTVTPLSEADKFVIDQNREREQIENASITDLSEYISKSKYNALVIETRPLDDAHKRSSLQFINKYIKPEMVPSKTNPLGDRSNYLFFNRQRDNTVRVDSELAIGPSGSSRAYLRGVFDGDKPRFFSVETSVTMAQDVLGDAWPPTKPATTPRAVFAQAALITDRLFTPHGIRVPMNPQGTYLNKSMDIHRGELNGYNEQYNMESDYNPDGSNEF
jgi:hypothetical protein